MTRKDYVAIAAALKAISAEYAHSVDYEQGVGAAVIAVADVMARDNPRFDRGRFLKACGVQS